MLIVPFDFAATRSLPDWRQNLRWPSMISELREVGERLTREITALGHSHVDGEDGKAILLSGPVLIGQALIAIEAAWSLARTQAEGLQMVSEADEVRYLRGELDVPPVPAFRRVPQQKAATERLLRQIARTATWTPPHRLPATLLKPQAFAVNHNGLLRQEVRRSGRRVLFQDGDHLLLTARSAVKTPPETPAQILNAIVDIMTGMVPVQGALADRLRDILQAKVNFHLAQAYLDLQALRNFPFPALELWSGTAGNRVSRALAFAVKAQGGTTKVFDHGGSTGMLASGALLGLTEGAATDRFYALSPGLADLCREGPLGREIALHRQMEFVGGSGDPHIRTLDARPPQRHGTRARVMLVTGAYLGHRQINPPLPRDPVYLDWHMRLVQILQTLPIDLILKPHPEGLFRGQPHPLGKIGQVLTAPFEASLAEADLLLFDFPLSTTFWTAMCSRHPIVYADLGVAPLNARVMQMIRQRCVTAAVHWNDRGLPDIERDALGTAISQALAMPVEAEAFRDLYLKTDS